MRTAIIAACMLGSATLAGVALAQTKPPVALEPMVPPTVAAAPVDARTMASDREVGEARRGYRAQCNRYESASFCECVTAGMAQALAPSDLRLAARTVGARITAQGDAQLAGGTDQAPAGASPMERIETAEGFYADACAAQRG